ncbi:MAG: arsenate reductase (azurin) small subunit [Betaproteobacteria bacterium]|nr:arsenate reductase (azurin) small subunit [Betaproteobacteria bacterium]
MNAITIQAHDDNGAGRQCVSRRAFLLSSGAIVSLAGLGIPGLVDAAGTPLQALRATYPRQRIGKLSALAKGKPVHFKYPYPSVDNILVKLGAPAGGGIGVELDVVAFNLQCTHMGGPLHGSYKEAHQMLGPCPLHLTTFDLTRHGMVVAGHGTESLPQIVLEVAGDDIHAVGVMGLIYGYAHNVTGSRRG